MGSQEQTTGSGKVGRVASIGVDGQQNLVRTGELDESRGRRLLDFDRLAEYPIGVMLRRQSPVRGDDRGAGDATAEPENGQEGGLAPDVTDEQGSGTATPIRLPRPGMFRVIDILEAVLLPQSGQSVDLESETESEIEQGGVLMERDKSLAGCQELNGSLQ